MSTGSLLDTGILVHLIRDDITGVRIRESHAPLLADPRPLISVITEGEIRSLAYQWRWGEAKRAKMAFLLEYFDRYPIEVPEILEAYAVIDAYSESAGRSMGKNDVWIAATAHVTGRRLLTADVDFDHLHPRFVTRTYWGKSDAGGAMNVRKPRTEEELRYWLEVMVWHHTMSDEEISSATGLTLEALQQARARFNIEAQNRPKRPADSPLLVLPYPGGRHPRIQFLEGAIHPQRETKVSVFAPWDELSYVVADVPEAIWSNLGLTYLAHTHIPTVWDKRGVRLEPLEWNRREQGVLELERTLPNGIRFGTKVTPGRDAVRMEMWLVNGSDAPLADLRVQNCVMLKGCSGFEQLTNENKVFAAPYAACRNPKGDRWVVAAWDHPHRTWGNPPCPCLHSDPRFPDCAPGETRRLRGWLSFHQGTDIQAEFKRIEALGWRGDR